MDQFNTLKVPEHTEKVFSHRICDACKYESAQSTDPDHVNWGRLGAERGNYDHVTVRRCHGTINNNYDQVTTTEFHLCGRCFNDLIRKPLIERGVWPVERMSGPGKVQNNGQAA